MKITTILGLVILSCFMTTDNKYYISITSIASENHSDIFPVKFEDGILFSSREKHEPYYKLYYSEIIANQHLDDPIPVLGDIAKNNLTPSAYIKESGELYLTSNRKSGVDNIHRLGIYRAKIKDFKLINLEECNIGHERFDFLSPTFSKDGLKMILSSDRFGTRDLLEYERKYIRSNWKYIRRINELCGENTHESSPYLHNDTLLIYSVRPEKSGEETNFDLYISALQEDNTWGDPRSMEELNTEYNELSLTFIDENSGYFTSDLNNKDDIYYFEKE